MKVLLPQPYLYRQQVITLEMQLVYLHQKINKLEAGSPKYIAILKELGRVKDVLGRLVNPGLYESR